MNITGGFGRVGEVGGEGGKLPVVVYEWRYHFGSAQGFAKYCFESYGCTWKFVGNLGADLR